MTRSRILPIQTKMHFAGLAIDKMQAALGRPGQKLSRPASVPATCLVVPQPVWDVIGPGIRMLAGQFGLSVREGSSYHVGPGTLLIEFTEQGQLTRREQLIRWFNGHENAWAGVGRISRDIGLGSPVLAHVFWKNPDTFESRPARCSWNEYRLRKSPDSGAGKPPFAAAIRVG